jgi:hypothetical protein
MAKKPTEARRKLVEFDAETWQALDVLTRDSMKTFQELADEAFRDLLRKYGPERFEGGAAAECAILRHAGCGVTEAQRRTASLSGFL